MVLLEEELEERENFIFFKNEIPDYSYWYIINNWF